jgi:hypothetical protein
LIRKTMHEMEKTPENAAPFPWNARIYCMELDLTYYGTGELGLLKLNILFQHLLINFMDSDIFSQ